MVDEDGNPILCARCDSPYVEHTDCTDWVCAECAMEYNLNTSNPEVYGFSKWSR